MDTDYDFGLSPAKNIELTEALQDVVKHTTDREGMPIIIRSCIYLKFGTDPSVYKSEVEAKIVEWLNVNLCAKQGWEDMTVHDMNFG